jgi:hypothetical protein
VHYHPAIDGIPINYIAYSYIVKYITEQLVKMFALFRLLGPVFLKIRHFKKQK